MNGKLQEIEEIVREKLKDSAHDMEHVMRVYAMCQRLSEGEPGVKGDVIQAAALLHDIARIVEDTDNTGSTDHALLGAEMAGEILGEKQFPPEFVGHVKECIRSHRLRSGEKPESQEAQILYDADKLDVLGALGVARCFMIAGRYSMPLFSDENLDVYAKRNLVGGEKNGRIKDLSQHAPNIEFEIKLRDIPERLFTEGARSLARERLAFMEEFFGRLHGEIQGDI
jgi:uncharacterized protein